MRDVVRALIVRAQHLDPVEAAGAAIDALVDMAPFGIAFFDRELRVAGANPAFAAITDWPAGELVHRPVAEVCAKGAELAALAAEVRDTGDARLDERWMHQLVHCYPIRVAGEIASVGCIVEPERTSWAEDPTLMAICHELRTPLAALLMWEKVLRDNPADGAVRARALEAIRDSALTQLRMVDGLFDVARARRDGRHLASQPAALADELAAAASPDLRGVRVLLVDDNRDMLDALATLLGAAGATVETATSAASAWELVVRRLPDVVVSDLAMSDEGGYSLIGRVREHAATRALYMVALTAHAFPADRARALAAGFDQYVAKPVDPDELGAILAGARAAPSPIT